MARSGMTNLLTRLRQMIDDEGTADWTDAQLQDVLDEHRRDVYRERLKSVQEYVGGGSVEYHVVVSRHDNLETADSGTSAFYLEDADGTDHGTADYSADYLRGEFTFTADLAGSSVFMTARSYDLAGAAAEVWRRNAAAQADKYDVGTQGTTMSRSQWFQHCREMAEFYAAKGRPKHVHWLRSDLNA